MIVSSTEVQNNFGKYLMLAAEEDVIVTRNGVPVAKLLGLDSAPHPWGSISSIVRERAHQMAYGPTKATYQEFLELTRDSEERYEYIDGEIYLLASPRTPHQAALTELFGQFYNWFQGKECRPFVAPYYITLRRSPEQISVVQPDIMIICDLDEQLGEDGYYKGVPTLLVEILSDSTARKDLLKKLDLYMSCGVDEYWIVDPEDRLVLVYGFQDKKLSRQALYKPPEKAQSQRFPGLEADLVQIFR